MSCDSSIWDDPSSFSFSMSHHYTTMNFSERTEDFVVVVVVGMQSVVPNWEGSRRRSMNMMMIVRVTVVLVVVVIVLVAVTSCEASSPL